MTIVWAKADPVAICERDECWERWQGGEQGVLGRNPSHPGASLRPRTDLPPSVLSSPLPPSLTVFLSFPLWSMCCVSVCVCVHMCVSTHVQAQSRQVSSSTALYFIYRGRVAHGTWNLLILTVLAGQFAIRLSYFCLQSAGIREGFHKGQVLCFYMGSRNRNSGPHIGMASSLLVEPSP